jgi:transposase
MVRDTYLRTITEKERNTLHLLTDEDDPAESGYRAKIILLKDDGYTVPEIRKITNHHDNNIRKWIHKFNEKGVNGIISKIHKHKSIKFTDEIEKQIVEIAARNPRTHYGLPFSTWSLRLLAGFIMKDMKLVDDDRISHTEIRNILLKHGIRWRQSKMIVENSKDPEYNIKKVH